MQKFLLSAGILLLVTSFTKPQAQSLQIQYSGRNEKIIAAVAEANRILNNPAFYSQIEAVASFSNSSYSGTQVSNEIKNLHMVIKVDTYWNPLGVANASTVATINVNTAKLRRSHASITNTIIHEMVHAVDWLTNNNWDYTHDGNSPAGQESTAPWVVGAIAENMVH